LSNARDTGRRDVLEHVARDHEVVLAVQRRVGRRDVELGSAWKKVLR
jgi:hypothetical protein